MDVTIRTAQPADAALVAELAARTFREAFAADNTPEDLELHLARSYGVPQQTAELADATIVTLLAEAAGQPAGYAQVRDHPAPACVTGPRPIELWRFYVARAWHGQGVAQRLMDRVDATARARGAGTVWLCVWERNPRAIAFYRKCGFVDVGSQLFVLGTDPQHDRIMVRPLPPEPAPAAGT